MPRTMAELAREAIQVQNTRNMRGLSKTFAKVVDEVADLLDSAGVASTDRVNMHPVVQLWVSKLHDLGRMGLSSPGAYGFAYEECERLASGNSVE